MLMSHPIHRVTSLELIGAYSLRLQFDDGLVREIDFEEVLEGELFGPLRVPELFSQVSLDPEAHTIYWPTGADLDPATLHDWPIHEQAFRAAAKLWKKAIVQPNTTAESGSTSIPSSASVARSGSA